MRLWRNILGATAVLLVDAYYVEPWLRSWVQTDPRFDGAWIQLAIMGAMALANWLAHRKDQDPAKQNLAQQDALLQYQLQRQKQYDPMRDALVQAQLGMLPDYMRQGALSTTPDNGVTGYHVNNVAAARQRSYNSLTGNYE